MAQKRKLQVFVSSTYTDLIEERQAAVEAILTASHIPAGMELFAGQNEEQMNIIKRWIDESDIYLLLLGGRYGSIEATSNKSYTHLEYDYAKEMGKAVFVVVATVDYIEKKAKKFSPSKVMELEHRLEYDNFKKSVTGKYVKYWTNIDKLQLAIINTLHELERDESLVGWVVGSEASNFGAIAEELARLTKENSELRNQLSSINKGIALPNGIYFEELYKVLTKTRLLFSDINLSYLDCFNQIAQAFGDEFVSTLHIFWAWEQFTSDKTLNPNGNDFLSDIIVQLERAGIVEEKKAKGYIFGYNLTDTGKMFLIKLLTTHDVELAQLAVSNLKKQNEGHVRDNLFAPYLE